MTGPVSSGLPPLGGAPRRRRGAGVLAAIACISLFGVQQGMQHPLFALRLEAEGWSSGAIGVSGAMVALSALVCTPLMPPLIRRMGLAAFLASGALLSGALLLLFPLFEGYWAWLGLRFLQGSAAAALFLGAETWIVSGAEPGARGRIVGLYASMLSLGFASGPLILTGVGVEGWTPFAVSALLSLCAVAPLIAGWRDAPDAEPDDRPAISPLRFILVAPTVLGAVVLYGAIEFGVMGLLPVWGVQVGLGPAAAAFLVSALIFGNVIFQIPLGALAERMSRRPLLILCAGVSIAAAALLPALAAGGWALWAMLLVWGGIAAGLYTIALIELGARYGGATLVAANAAVVIAYGIGALAGPVLAGGAMDLLGPHGLSVALGAMGAVYLAVALLRAPGSASAARPG